MGKIKYPIINGLKQCGGCGEWKALPMYNHARKHYTAKCRDCLAVWAKDYRQRPEVKEASRGYLKDYMANPANRERRNKYGRNRNKLGYVKEKRNQERRAWAVREKRKAVEYKGGECSICGYSACLAAMDFHHKNPLEKDGYGTGALKQHWAFERNKHELDKCILVCVRCHREIHAGVAV